MRTLILLGTLALGAGQVNAQDANAAYAASYTAEASKDYAGAIRALKNAAGAEADEYFYNLRMGWLHYASGLYNESAKYYRLAAREAPKAVEPLQGLLMPLAAAGKNEELDLARAEILKLDPNNYKILSAQAWASYTNKDYPAAARYYAKIVKLYPSDTEMLLGLGWSQKMSGFKNEAVKTFNTVLRLSPKNPRALEGLK